MTASQIRKEARQKLSGKWGKACVITILFSVIVFIISYVLNLIPFVGRLLSLIISVPLSFGLTLSMVKLNDDSEVSYTSFLSDGFNNFGKSWTVYLQMIVKLIIPIILQIITTIILYLGYYSNNSTAFYVGLILFFLSLIYYIFKQFLYKLSYYVLCDNPELTGKEAVEKSEELMKGNVWSIICLDLSFIGWAILSAVVLGLGFIVLSPYMQVSEINFYRNLAGTKKQADSEPEVITEPSSEK